MKTTSKFPFLCFCGLALLLLAGCGNKNKSEVKEDVTVADVPTVVEVTPHTFTAAEQAKIDEFFADRYIARNYGTDVKKVDSNGETLLHKLLPKWDVVVAQYLVSQGIDINAKENRAGLTALHRATGRVINNLEITTFLVSNGADINVKDSSGNTPLLMTGNIEMGNVEIVQLLVSKGADINAKDNSGNTPLHVARNVEIAKFLISKGADINAKNNSGNTPLESARNTNVSTYLHSVGGTRRSVYDER